jgi:hypothetical protein
MIKSVATEFKKPLPETINGHKKAVVTFLR